MTDGYVWFKRSRQAWKVGVIWIFVTVSILAGILGFWAGWHTRTKPVLTVVVFGSALGAFVVGMLVRCPVCNDGVVATLLMERPRARILDRMALLEACPVCGDPGDGSNPKHW